MSVHYYVSTILQLPVTVLSVLPDDHNVVAGCLQPQTFCEPSAKLVAVLWGFVVFPWSADFPTCSLAMDERLLHATYVRVGLIATCR